LERHRLTFASCTCSLLLLLVYLYNPCHGQGKDFNAYPENVANYLDRLYDESEQELSFRNDFPGGFEAWKREARTALQEMLGMDEIASSVGDHRISIFLMPTPPSTDVWARRGAQPFKVASAPINVEEVDDLGEYTRNLCVIETEPDVHIPFWLLMPKGEGPFPLGVFPHGHDSLGHNTTAGVYSDTEHEQKSLAEDRDVAVQAVKLGFVAIAPAIRGLSTSGVPDIHGRHGNRDCRSHVMHCLIAGRTATGERVWDMQRILDWAVTLPEVDPDRILMMGNSGGGMVTLFTAACDDRIKVAVPSCSFAPSVSEGGYLFHCDCNMVPALLDIGGLPGVAGLIAPRHLLAVNGRKDTLFSEEEIERGTAMTGEIFEGAGCPEHFEHRWGEEGHRFYSDLMWPFVLDVLEMDDASEE
jgi:dienelactone hydrolase